MPKNLTAQSNTFFAPDRAAWHAWLAEHGSRENEVWLISKVPTSHPASL
jgi:hypothetical protein